MKSFFYKKYVFTAIFLSLLMLFAAANICYGAEEIEDICEELAGVRTLPELSQWMEETAREAEENVLGKSCFVESYGFLQELLQKREYDHFTYIKDADGMMYYGSLSKSDNDDLEQYADRVRRLKKAVEAKGAKLIVVIPPAKLLYGINEISPQLPVSDPNARMDKFLNLMM